MAKKNVKLPKGAIKKLAKAYAQLEQRRRQEEAILALGPSLADLHEEKKKRRRRTESPPRRRSYYTYKDVGPHEYRPRGPGRAERRAIPPIVDNAMDIESVRGYKRRRIEVEL